MIYGNRLVLGGGGVSVQVIKPASDVGKLMTGYWLATRKWSEWTHHTREDTATEAKTRHRID